MDEAFISILSAGCVLGESPVWSRAEQQLLFVDIKGCRLHFYRPHSGDHRCQRLDEEIGCVAPAKDGGYVAGLRSGVWLLGRDGEKRRLLAANPEDQSVSRFNDGCVDPCGRYWAGTVDEPKAGGKAHLYRYDRRGLTAVQDGLLTSNGLAFSPDGRTMYHSDTPRYVVYRYDYDAASGTAENRRPFIRWDRAATGPGRPDGAAVDVEGCYWTALYEGSRIERYDADGTLMAAYALPALKPTMPAFGGPDGRTLFVTTAGDDLYAMAAPVAGLERPCFDEAA